MNEQRDESTKSNAEQPAPPVVEEQPPPADHDFLVPGPTPYSNVGLRRWGCTWLAFSLILILLMLGLSFVCWVLATWTGFA